MHSLSDGLALGAAVFASQVSKMNFIVVLIIVLHKIPETFGFGTYIALHKKEGWKAFKYIIPFTGAAPLGAIIVYAILYFIKNEISNENLFTVIGLLLVFSAGTFLYAATMHVMPEVLEGQGVPDRNKKLQIVLMGICTFLPAFTHLLEHEE